jgi:drug/metabolite transporter (DMT)-like permease
MGIIFAITNALLLGFANFLLKKSFKDFPPSVSFFIFGFFSFIIWGLVGLLWGIDFTNIWLGVFVGVVSAILGQGIYVYVLEKGELSITATILSSFSIYTIIFSMLFNEERPSLLTLFFIGLTIIGTIIVSLPKNLNITELKKINLILWAVFAAICIGAADTLSKFYITKTSVGSFLFYVSIAQLFISMLYLRFDKQPLGQFKQILNKLDEYKFALLGSLGITISTLCLFLSFNFTLASIASPIGASYPIVTIILALLFLKEKISVKNWIGLAFVLTSIIIIGIINP